MNTRAHKLLNWLIAFAAIALAYTWGYYHGEAKALHGISKEASQRVTEGH